MPQTLKVNFGMVKTIVKESYDIIVVGGGIAGCSAALSAAREGKNVLLIEKHINLGGLATIGLISWFEPLCDGDGHKIVSGNAEEFMRLAIDCGYDNLHSVWGGKSGNKPLNDRCSTYFSPTCFSLALDKLLRGNGVNIMYDTLVTYPEIENNIIKGIITENTDGRSFYPCKIVIDCTGEATVARRAGVPTRTFNNESTFVVHDTSRDRATTFSENGDMTELRHWQWFKTREGLIDDYNSQTENKYLKDCKSVAIEHYSAVDKNSREILTLPELPQIRLIRAIIGEKTFLGRVEDKDSKISDSIGSMSDFAHLGYRFEIPYGCLYNSGFPNLLCAGRIVSAQDNGISVLRVIPGCCLTGQAAGIAAAIAIESNDNSVVGIYDKLRLRLEDKGVSFVLG